MKSGHFSNLFLIVYRNVENCLQFTTVMGWELTIMGKNYLDTLYPPKQVRYVLNVLYIVLITCRYSVLVICTAHVRMCVYIHTS